VSEVSLDLPSGGVLLLVRDPARNLDPSVVERSLPHLVNIARSAFENDAVTESDVRLHAVEVRYGVYLRIDDEDVAFASADVFFPSSLPTPAVYLEGSAVHQDWQEKHYYWPLIACRLAIGKALGAGYVTTRTPNPRVCRSLRRFQPYPIFDRRPELAAAAEEIAHEIYAHHSDYQRPDGFRFDRETGVQHNAYAGRMNKTAPVTGDARIETWFEDHVNVDAGDALVLLSELREDACAPDTERAFGISFRELVDRVRTITT
jgi:hypothetical protein